MKIRLMCAAALTLLLVAATRVPPQHTGPTALITL